MRREYHWQCRGHAGVGSRCYVYLFVSLFLFICFTYLSLISLPYVGSQLFCI
jgi:hypothetical protein